MKPKELKEGQSYDAKTLLFLELLPEDWETSLNYSEKKEVYAEWGRLTGLVDIHFTIDHKSKATNEEIMTELIQMSIAPNEPLDLELLDTLSTKARE